MRFPTENRGAMGTTGTGKTTLLRELMHDEIRRGSGYQWCVHDVNEEHGEGAPVQPVFVRTASGVRRALAAGRMLVIRRPDPRSVLDAANDDEAEEIMRRDFHETVMACLAEPSAPRHLVVPEIQRVAPLRRTVPKSLGLLLYQCQHPHVRCGVWWDSQLPQEVSLRVRGMTSTLYLFASGLPDEDLRKMGGPGLVTALRRAGELHDAGHRGYHVRLTPYARQREAYDLRRIEHR